MTQRFENPRPVIVRPEHEPTPATWAPEEYWFNTTQECFLKDYEIFDLCVNNGLDVSTFYYESVHIDSKKAVQLYSDTFEQSHSSLWREERKVSIWKDDENSLYLLWLNSDVSRYVFVRLCF